MSVHSSMTVWRISFMNTMNALSGFLMCWPVPVLRGGRAAPLEPGSPDVERVDAADAAGPRRRCPCPGCCLQQCQSTPFCNPAPTMSTSCSITHLSTCNTPLSSQTRSAKIAKTLNPRNRYPKQIQPKSFNRPHLYPLLSPPLGVKPTRVSIHQLSAPIPLLPVTENKLQVLMYQTKRHKTFY